VDNLTTLWTKTNLQDLELCEANQRGVNSIGYVPGPYSEEPEFAAVRFVNWYCNEARAYLARETGDDRLAPMRPRLAAGAGGG
jgi:Rieske 2Fe-2S family protein